MTNKHTFYPDSTDDSSRERLLPRRELRALVPVSDMTIWRWERDGGFPRHLSINSRNYWRLSELRAWIKRQQRAGESPGSDGLGDGI